MEKEAEERKPMAMHFPAFVLITKASQSIDATGGKTKQDKPGSSSIRLI